MEKVCIECDKTFEGRMNQKFCTQKCKNAYHNARNREKESVVIQTNKILHRNWNVLQKMYEVYRSKPVQIEILEANGYKPKYHTHTHNSPVGEKYQMVYDYGIKNYYDNQVQIVKGDMLV
tara:strand:+ start:1080 stop:1439 length:360 start_codon:yes stop_codon:yes gene_type:complete